MNIIIYGSQYGTTRRYAEELAKITGYELKSYEDAENINSYETIIYMGGLYAGGVLGMKKTFKNLTNTDNKKIIIITVGLADLTDVKNTDNIKAGVKKQLSEKIYDISEIFHLRGGIDYSRLNFKHKTMMSLLYKKVVKLPEDKKTAEDRAMIETYNKQVDFVDFNCLNPIINSIMPKKKMTDEEVMKYIEEAYEMFCNATEIPALSFELTETEPDIFSSKIGGTPYIPHEMEIPTDNDSRQMKLLAQVDCRLLAELPDYPHEGMLQFWLSVKYPWKEWRVVYHKTIDTSVTEAEILSKITPFIEGETGEFPVINGGYGIETQLVYEAMSNSDERYGNMIGKYLADLTEGKIFTDYDGDINELIDSEFIGNGHKLGGYHYDPQSWTICRFDPNFKIDIGTEDEVLLLFQLEYDHKLGRDWRDGAKVVIGDCGVMNFFIKRKDLKALNFDKVMYNWSCS